LDGVCPNGHTHMVWRTKEYWEQMSPDAPARGRLAPPAVPAFDRRTPMWLGVVGILLMLLGGTGIVLGAVAVLAAFGAAYVLRHRVEDAQAALARWEASYYCVTCPRQFVKVA
jgi:hypothetical protein